MIFLESRDTQIDDLLDKMAEAVQLDDTRYDRMVSSYEAVKNWIEGDELFFKPFKYEVYPHGSVRIQTTVKPIEKDEFDLDIAFHMHADTPHSPERIYKEIVRRLMEHETYKKMIELKNRCVRLNYAGDFHMDILPGVQEFYFDQHRLEIHDHELRCSVSSSPRAYANWFLEKANSLKQSLLEKAMNAEAIPTDNFKRKKPLQRAVQLIKRYRDEYFQTDDTYKTSSIILTTIAGQLYDGEESIFETVDQIVSKIVRKVGGFERLKVFNPVNQDEDFTDKWDSEPEYYDAFKKFAFHLYNEWQKLKEKNGILAESEIMKGLFGEDTFNKAQTEQTLFIAQIRNNRNLGVVRTNGNIATAVKTGATVIAKNTFFS